MNWCKRRFVVLALLCGLVMAVGGGVWFQTSDSRAVSRLAELRKQFWQRDAAVGKLPSHQVAKSKADFELWQKQARELCLQIAAKRPGTRAAATALFTAAGYWPDTTEGRAAHDQLLHAAATADISEWAMTLDEVRIKNHESHLWQPLAAALIQRVDMQPGHPDAAWLLCKAAVLVSSDQYSETTTEEFVTIANLIRERYAASQGLSNFCEKVGGMGDAPTWGTAFEPHLRRILELNQDRFVRCSAKLALASVVRTGGIERQSEAQQLLEEFLGEFDGETYYPAQSVEKLNRQVAQRILKSLKEHGLGAPALATVGVDLEGRSMSLADYRGKVILLSFWATWCGPCMRAIPHEKELLDHFAPEQFAIVGVNGDKQLAEALHAVAEHGMSWRSFQNGLSIADDWHVQGWPTFYLLDAEGRIVQFWTGLPPQDKLRDSIRTLIIP